MIYCTSYESPDLDGVACSIAYAEYLNLTGKNAKPVYFGSLGLETKFFETKFGNLPIKSKSGGYGRNDNIILLDTADPDAIDSNIPPEKVTEIFDHRKLVFLDKFTQATTTIELVGSCATLITERFMNKQIKPSELTATLLYGAIVSNTINFKNKVTTGRDIKAAGWLKSGLDLSNDFVKSMFGYKSNFEPNNISQILNQDFSIKEFGGEKVGIAQLEVVELPGLLNLTNKLLINFLHEKIRVEKLDYVLFTGIDVYEGFNILVTADEKSEKFFSKVLGIEKIGEGYKTKEIIMRKEIWPKISNLTP